MKKTLVLLACLLALTLGASAQNRQPVSSIAIPPTARGGERATAIGITTIHLPPAAQSADAAAKPAPNGGPQGPPVAKTPPSAVHVSPTAKK